MNQHLSVRINGQFLALPDDASIDIEDSNPFFNDTQETWSLPFEVPINENREILGNVDDIRSDLRLVSHENKLMDVFIDGIEFRNGKVATTEDQEIKDKVSLSMTSINKQLTDLFGDLTLQDITFPEEDKNDLQIGEMLGDVVASGTCSYYTVVKAWGWEERGYEKKFDNKVEKDVFQDVQLHALGFSTNKLYKTANYKWEGYREGEEVVKDSSGNPIVEKNFVNVETPYGAVIMQPDGSTRRALYFNARICYLHYKVNSDGTSSDSVQINNNSYGPYYVLEADRPQSGICFYILYVIKSIFKYFGLVYGSEQEAVLMNMPDLCRLGFYTTKCKYDRERKFKGYSRNSLTENDFVPSDDFDKNGMNAWLLDHRTNGSLKPAEVNTIKENKDKFSAIVPTDDGPASVTKDSWFWYEGVFYHVKDIYVIPRFVYNPASDFKYSGNIFKMYANTENLPEMSISSFIDSLFASFGIKFHYDTKTNVVTPHFIRDILRDKRDPIVMPGDAWTIHKVSEKITGFKMRYSGESDSKEQENYIRKRVTDYDTSYDYIVERSADIEYFNYEELVLKGNGHITATTMTCFVDIRTGNCYRVKIDKEALDKGDASNLKPVLFQVAQWHGVEIGDCSEENEDFIIELVSDFQPLDQNNVNGEVHASTPLLCPFIDEDMWNEYTDMSKNGLRIPFEDNTVRIYAIDAIIGTNEKYDPTSTEDGNSPLQSHDWGNAICVMRGGGADAHIDYYDYDYDGYGSYKIRTIAGKYAMDSDSISLAAEEYDYNGDGEVIVYDNRYDGTYTKDQALEIIASTFNYSNAAIASPDRRVTAAAMRAKGWDVPDTDDYCTVFSQGMAFADYGYMRQYLVTPILDDGTILTPDELRNYMANLSERSSSRVSIRKLDALGKRVIIAFYPYDELGIAMSTAYGQLLHQLHAIYYGDATTVSCPIPVGTTSNGIGEGERFSLKIRAFHTNPKTGEVMCNNDRIARRGLYDRFMADYAHFVLNRKKVTITGRVNAIDIKNIQWDRRYNIGGMIGWINKISTHITAEKGIETCTFEMYIL